VNRLEAEYFFSENLYQIKRKVIVVIPVAWNSMRIEDTTLLNKILASIKLNLNSVQILSTSTTSLNQLITYEPSAIILFGVNFTPTVKTFSSENFKGVTVIASEALDKLDDVKKKSLWNALKQAFKL
jgi:hypothetical protein